MQGDSNTHKGMVEKIADDHILIKNKYSTMEITVTGMLKLGHYSGKNVKITIEEE
jgi:hypothetical protein